MYYKEENNLFRRKTSISYYDVMAVNSYEPILTSIQFFKSKQDFTYRKHCHPSYEIVIPRTGDYKCLLNGQVVSVQAGELLLVQEGDWHQDILHVGTEYIVMAFVLKRQDKSNVKHRLFRENIDIAKQKIIFPTGKFINAIFNLLTEAGSAEENNVADVISARQDANLPVDIFYDSTLKPLVKTGSAERDYGLYYVLDGLFQAFFWEIIFLFPQDRLSPLFNRNLSDEALKSALFSLFERNIHGKLNVPKIAADMNMSESSLAHKCKQFLGESPARSFMRHKLAKAETYINTPQLTIKEISDMFGFEDQFHFSKTFKRFYGRSPVAYRKKA
jgi:AraC-like DNA-binding protein